MTKINPRELHGSWTDGFALDLHSTGSTFIGHDEYGHPRYHTHRTEVGDLLYRMKYRGDPTALTQLVQVAARFIEAWGVSPDLLLPVPPTRTRRIQPVYQIVDQLSVRLDIPPDFRALYKRKDGGELKDVLDYQARRELLEGAFEADPETVRGRAILLVDDLVRSGATMNAASEALAEAGASAVYVLALTETRRK
jgi:competence protein ComFC